MPTFARPKDSTFVAMHARGVLLAFMVALSACSTGSDSIMQTLKYTALSRDSTAGARLNPNYRYLRVTIAGRVVLLALGYEDVDSIGIVEVWYSAEKEVLRIQNGRLVGAVGLTAEWRNVLMPKLPSWSTLARRDKAFRWTRVRDVMPGYHFGVQDSLSVRVISQPMKSELQGANLQGLVWFEEQVDIGQDAGLFWNQSVAATEILPPARYAVDIRDEKEIVVYGEQCLERDLCFSWQRWPMQGQSAAGQK